MRSGQTNTKAPSGIPQPPKEPENENKQENTTPTPPPTKPNSTATEATVVKPTPTEIKENQLKPEAIPPVKKAENEQKNVQGTLASKVIKPYVESRNIYSVTSSSFNNQHPYYGCYIQYQITQAPWWTTSIDLVCLFAASCNGYY